MRKYGVTRAAKILERKISARNLNREDDMLIKSYELKQAMLEIARLNGALDLAKAEIADLRHRMSSAFGAMEMAENMTGVFAKHVGKYGVGAAHCVVRQHDYKDGGGTGDYFIHQKEY